MDVLACPVDSGGLDVLACPVDSVDRKVFHKLSVLPIVVEPCVSPCVVAPSASDGLTKILRLNRSPPQK